ncbi:MAG: SDR family NAD(P)-dependent oxidoreductase, partial [Gemmataceae bacterium]
MYSRTFLITGASKGIGLAVSQRFARAGHRVVGIARNASAPDFPGTLVPADLGNRESAAQALVDLTSRFTFDGLVNNVATVLPQRLGEIDLDSFDETLRVNLHPAILATQALLPG